MNFITTNIRLPEDEYLKLKAEAANKRKSLAAVIRDKITTDKDLSQTEIENIMADLDRIAKRNSKKLKGWNSLQALREIRDEN
ncbi:hypothetical protein A3C26_02765 [Candidatus Daviesbacteria bacterium RIFCSPHIGHO2_02_FULL_39_12]|uniref:Uncharacterized protein n=2 Tax=Candidatus Daviesiibacteriota TaxID=1752718 RepID=A0A1F5JC54_9BACT|nr:MAG: hypothetical protein A3C26_02765 [Candidatus Daviesbacteria bacterium RIFCSPHIGHO2_02_FULL_39_12]OGE72087.1 MAG: hypothetical protein A3H40_03220 [Candidatus Daviesbacteria bacterium RIFCSPLOWO2_02_FULL_38_15]